MMGGRAVLKLLGLNAPFGARCFLTRVVVLVVDNGKLCLNAPFGARCFLTRQQLPGRSGHRPVLMHLLALGAF